MPLPKKEPPATPSDDDSEIRIGISSCLLGEKVRYDGGHKRDAFLNDTLGQFVSFVPVCPEFEIGMGVPRESVRLVRDGEQLRMVAPKSGTDYTTKMVSYSRRRSKELAADDLCGYIFKKDSPSCGLFRVRVFGKGDTPTRNGRGLFAQAMTERFPLLPVEEEGRLHDARLRENFFERVFAYWRVKRQFRARWSVGSLVAFHAREKLLLMAHDPKSYSELGQLVATAKGRDRRELADEYMSGFMAILAKIATTRKHTNVLQHILGYFKKTLDADDRAELLEVIDDFHAGRVPLIVAVTLFRHHVRRQRVDYLSEQTYLAPHPKELMLRNHV